MTKKRKSSPDEHPPGSKFLLYAKAFDEEGRMDVENCGWISVAPTKIVRHRSDAMVFTSAELGKGSGEDWKKFFEDEMPGMKISVCWVEDEKKPVRY